MPIRSLFLMVLLAVAGNASAQSMPRPAEFYFDSDAKATRPMVAIKGNDEATMQRLAKLIERKPDAIIETAQLAHLAMVAGRVELGRQLYTRAVARMSSTSSEWRPVLWNYGWDLYRAGDDAGAHAQWQQLATARSVTASWMPPTFALVLWSLQRKDEAVQWYAAAVRTEPDQWRTANRYPALLPDWTDGERATLAEVQAAWAQNPPAWP